METSACFCDGAYKRIPAPPGSPYGTPPLQRGRPLAEACKPSTNAHNVPVLWGGLPYEKLYGPKGWCTAEKPEHMCGAAAAAAAAAALLHCCAACRCPGCCRECRWDACQAALPAGQMMTLCLGLARSCPCIVDGQGGILCDVPTEQFCLNQCAGHGTCVSGFCKCHAGWYGSDCSRKMAGQEMEAGEPPARAGDAEQKCLLARAYPAACRPAQQAATSSDARPTAGQQLERPWLKEFAVVPPAALPKPPEGLQRKRPFIYVYDMPPAYTSRMLQYRVDK